MAPPTPGATLLPAPPEPSVDAAEARTPSGVWRALGLALNPAAERPRLRVEVVETASHHTRAGEEYVVLKNRAESTYLRLGPREYGLLQVMDGTHTVGELVMEYFTRHGVLAFQRVGRLVQELKVHGFLAERHLDAYRSASQQIRERGGIAALGRSIGQWLRGKEVAIAGVDALVSGWYRAWAWILFTWRAQLLMAGLAMTGVALFAVSFAATSRRFFGADEAYAPALLTLVVLALVSTAFHELGHALALKHAGREIRRAGLIFYYGMPTFFVDTSDVWMAGPRARLATSWAGPYTALVLGGIASIAAFFSEGSALADIFWVWAFVCYLDVLFNLNPLLELDGYYMVVDALERPLLRQHALAFVRGPFWRKLWQRESLTPDERLLGIFGIGAVVWSLFSYWIVQYLWQARLSSVVQDLWFDEGAWGRAVVLAGVGAILLSIWLAVRPALPVVGRWVYMHSTLLKRRGEALRHKEAVQLLRGLAFLREVPERWLVEMAPHFLPVRTAHGEEVVRQGNAGRRFYIIRTGLFTVTKDSEVVATLGPGDYFGEIALLREVPRTATVTATTAGDLLALRGDLFRSLLGHELESFQRLHDAVNLRVELGTLPLFEALTPTEMDLLLTKLDHHTFEPGELIVRQGAMGDRFYVIRSGAVTVQRDGALVATLRPGDYFGEIALLMDVPRSATVLAAGHGAVEAWSLGRGDFDDVLGRYLGLAASLRAVGQRRLHALPAI